MSEISVIIPAYNAEKTIKQAIKTVLQQTFTDWELIVINDCSKDKTAEIVESIPDQRIRLFNYENGGVSTARNRGITHANGKFIAFLDADDLWTPDKLELQKAALIENPEAGVAYSWTYFMYEQGDAFTLHRCPATFFAGNVYEKLLVSDFIRSGSNTLIRSVAIELTGGFDPSCAGCADWDYWVRLAPKWQFVVVPKYQIFYRQTVGAMSSKVEAMKAEAMIALEKAYQVAPPELQYLKKYTLVSFHKYCAGLYLQHGNHRSCISNAGKHLWAAICLQPQTLLTQTTQRTLIKLLVKILFSSQFSEHLLQLISKIRNNEIRDFQL